MTKAHMAYGKNMKRFDYHIEYYNNKNYTHFKMDTI
jgi:hypothetical protein